MQKIEPEQEPNFALAAQCIEYIPVTFRIAQGICRRCLEFNGIYRAFALSGINFALEFS